MLALWMLYAILVGALLTGAAALLDGRSAFVGRGRWLWSVALLAAMAVPLVRPRVALRPAEVIDIGAAAVVAAPDGPTPAPEPSLLARVETTLEAWSGPLAGAWAGASAVLLALLLGSALRLRQRRREWRPGALDGTRVLISEALGPALVGLSRPEIVLPAWVFDLDATERALILAHEEEHRRMRDPALLALGLLAPVLFPWSPAAWLGFSRLRHAVEADCDHRVLARGLGSPVRYARLLLDVGSRVVGIIPVSAGFGEEASSLERRIRVMLRSRFADGPGSVMLRGTAAVVLLLAACMVDSPQSPTGTPDAGSAAATAAPKTDLERAPVFTPYTVGPKILNKTDVIRAMERDYPSLLRDAGIGGTTVVYFFIDAEGKVRDTRVWKSSGRPELDSAAVRVSSVYRFAPAMNRDKPVPVWVQFPITFLVRMPGPSKGTPEAPAAAGRAPGSAGTTPSAVQPTFTPYTVAPRILNQDEVVQAMEKAYPPLLRDAGIGGTTTIWAYVGTDGRIQQYRVARSSGREALDRAALSVSETYRFSPAMNKDKKVAVWIQFPVTFQVH